MRLRLFIALLLPGLLFAAPCLADGDDVHMHKIAEGTGFYISHDGYVLTANHVVSHCDGDISAHNEDMVLKTKLLASSPQYDLALLKVVPHIPIANIAYLRSSKRPLRPGEKVVVAGYPSNTTDLNREFAAFATNDAKIISTTAPNGKDIWMVFTLGARPGFSGGPVLDLYGNIVGVTSAGLCMNRDCTERFHAALDRLKSASTMDEVKAADDEVVASSDANIAANQKAIRMFLATNHLVMSERDSEQVVSEDRTQEIADSIVNLRCNQSDEDFRNATRIISTY